MIIRFNRQFTGAEKDVQREDKLMAELPGILNWALEGLQRLLKRGEYVIPASSEQEITQYRVSSDPVRQFSEEHLRKVTDKSLWIASSSLYSHYRDWSLTNGYKTLASNQFSERLQGVGIARGRNSTGRYWEAEYIWPTIPEKSQAGVSELAKNYSV